MAQEIQQPKSLMSQAVIESVLIYLHDQPYKEVANLISVVQQEFNGNLVPADEEVDEEQDDSNDKQNVDGSERDLKDKADKPNPKQDSGKS